jgi:chromate reductase
MILVIHGTNRKESLSKPVSEFVFNYLKENYSGQVELLDLAEIPIESFDSGSMYHPDLISPTIMSIKKQLINPAQKMIFISPEYNGSIPGILKLFIDACSITEAKLAFHHKKAFLIGVASGRSGNLRGMDHLTGILMYMNMIIYPNRLPVSRIENLLAEKVTLTDTDTQHAITKLLNEFILF